MSDPNNTFFFTFTCTTQYPVLENPNLSQAMAPSKQKHTHTVFRASSAHRSASTSKPRFVGKKVKLGELSMAAPTEPRNALSRIPEWRLDSIGKNQRYLKQIATLPVSSTLLQNLWSKIPPAWGWQNRLEQIINTRENPDQQYIFSHTDTYCRLACFRTRQHEFLYKKRAHRTI